MAYSQLCDRKYQPSATGLHDFVGYQLMRAARGEMDILILTEPPRHGKSRQVAVEFATWYLGKHPDQHVAVASYASHLSEKHSREARIRVRTPIFQDIFDVSMSDYRESAAEWILDQGGSYRAIGVGGSLTGFGVNVLIIDDPLKDHKEAHSDTTRDNIWNWFVSVANTRLEEPGVVIIIMTRWHPDDLVGRLEDPKRMEELEAAGINLRIEKYNIAAISKGEEADLLGRPEGEGAFPERQPTVKVKARKALAGSYVASALYDGEPVPVGGNMIDPRCFKIEMAPPENEKLRWVWSWDLASTSKEVSKTGDPDFTSGARMALTRSGDLWIALISRGQWKWPLARKKIGLHAMADGIPVGIEDQGGYRTAYDNLKEVLPGNVMLREVTVDVDKVTRALPWIALAENGKVHLIAGPWVEDFKKECLQFPMGAHDDQIDCVSNGYKMLESHTTGQFHEVQAYRRRRTLDDYGTRALY